MTASDTMTYRGCSASMTLDADDRIIVGRVLNVDEIIAFHGESNSEFESAFQTVFRFRNSYSQTMIVSSTPTIEGRPVREYLGFVTGETILGANILRDFMAGIRDVIGGRSSMYEKSLREAKDNAVAEMIQAAQALGADALLSVDLDYESISFGQGGGMLMVTASGTAVKL